ncbi:agmatinase [Telmatospirillum siberiense]|uniref:Agmatinase n=1 Tax=Telmatospirillum siberiense TaxID=382514 RepID=A0A2N3PU51_9PROT|nr:agmatinase [Telmatospirillum siberiense]PKU23928.1 agmatinase [Telmatospirillum siberiense]
MHVPTFSVAPTFLGTQLAPTDAHLCIAGIPLDIGVTNRPGARFAPLAIRHASRMLTDGDNPAGWADLTRLPFADVGDFAIALGDIPESLRLIEEQASAFPHLLTLGGEHTVTLPLLRALTKRTGPVGLIHFDAHIDTWPDNFGQVYGHGSVFYHAINEGLVDPARMVQIGIRSPMPRDVWDWTEGKGVTILSAEAVHESTPKAVAETIRGVVGDGPVYLSFDIDALDPSQAPGTGTPEIAGLFGWQAMAILKRLVGLDFVGMDVVEVSPSYDVAEITSLAAATLAWQYLSLLAQNLPAK